NSLEIKFSISHAIAQSLRLSHIEDDVLRLMKVNRKIPKDLAQTGKIKKSKKEISKLQGELYLKKTKMSFEYSILDKPEFFWLYPEFDSFYSRTIDYLELRPRIEILSKKIQTIDEILSILSNELNHRHSSRLEWIIILLILIEIVIFFLQDIFKLI
ncbi:MAG: RMD1 family protein, partial [Bacteriovoracaceae bacterium]|nr:RMD1 family protein [Bacteriovoracaceae bacterium]